MFFLSVHSFLFALSTAWLLVLLTGFSYPLWYEVLSIDAHIEQYVPQNNYNRGDFVTTSKKERHEIFSSISRSLIMSDIVGLRKLHYSVEYGPSNIKNKKFFRAVEINHLVYVSKLIRAATVFSLSYLLLFTASMFYMNRAGPYVKNFFWQRHLVNLFGLLLVPAACILFFGPKELFYLLHTMVFPENHVWFFYYQDSLMSTIMKAPYLFGAIGLQIMFLALIIYIVLWVVLSGKLCNTKATLDI